MWNGPSVLRHAKAFYTSAIKSWYVTLTHVTNEAPTSTEAFEKMHEPSVAGEKHITC